MKHVRSKNLFTIEEDNIIYSKVKKYGTKNWKAVASFLHNRTPRQVRERWKNYLSPNVNNRPFTDEEDMLLIELTEKYGSKWAKIAGFFPNRTDVNVKNRRILLKRKEMRESRQVICNVRSESIDKAPSTPTTPETIQQYIESDKSIESRQEIFASVLVNNEKRELIDFWNWETMVPIDVDSPDFYSLII